MNINPFKVSPSYSRWTMTCLLLTQSNYQHHGLIFRFLQTIATPSGVVISSAIHGHLIANYLVVHYAERCFQFLPESLKNTGIANWNNIYPCASFGDIPVLLANRDTEASTIQHPFISGSSHVYRSRYRSLDSLYVHSKQRVDVLHMAESASRVLDILAGSQVIISRDQPTLVIEMNSLEGVADVVRGLEGLNYVLLDSSLMPVDIDESYDIHSVAEIETCFLGLSKTFLQQNGLIQTFWPKDAYLAKHPNWQQALIAGFTREARNGFISMGTHSFAHYHYPFNDKLLCKGFYSTEQYDEHEWRWLGPKPSASIWLPQPPSGAYRLELAIIGTPKKDVVIGTRLFLNGAVLPITVEINEDMTTISAIIEIFIEQESPLIELVVAVPFTYRASADDPRMLGICVSHLDLIAISSGDR